MTVAELIEKLKGLPQDLPVVAYEGYEEGHREVRDVNVSVSCYMAADEQYKNDVPCVLFNAWA